MEANISAYRVWYILWGQDSNELTISEACK